MANDTPTIRKRSEHTVSRKQIDADALKVLYRLKNQGHTAYLVGGGVRDLLLGHQPKDFDISTDAHPRRIKRLFRNCFLIGRRFRLAHIRFGNKVIETSTFRRDPTPVDPDAPEENLLVHRDNTFGTPEEDARRRDFTVNALFYDIRTFAVIDHVGGLEDLDRKLIRSIGDPDVRFREDPVRMVRAVRFATRLGFRIERSTARAIRHHHADIQLAAPPRMYEEIQKFFAFGAGHDAFRLLQKTSLFDDLFPELATWLKGAKRKQIAAFWHTLQALDERTERDNARPAAMLFATLLYVPFHDKLTANGITRINDAMELARELLSPIAQRFNMPKRVFQDATTWLGYQQRLEAHQRRFSKIRFLHHTAFLPALTLLEIGVDAGIADQADRNYWRALYRDEQGRAPDTRLRLPDTRKKGKTGNRQRGRRPRRRPRRRNGRKQSRSPEQKAQ